MYIYIYVHISYSRTWCTACVCRGMLSETHTYVYVFFGIYTYICTVPPCRACSSKAGTRSLAMASNSSKSSGSAALATLGRGKYVSQSALSAVLKEIRELPEIPSATSRSSVKRARDELAESYRTPYGNIVQELQLQKENGDHVTVPVLHPAALLYWAAQRCTAFATIFQEKLLHRPKPHGGSYGTVTRCHQAIS